MRALQTLAAEHAAIAACCKRFETELDGIVGRCEVDAEALDRLLEFFEVQVDGHHQEKEERVLLPRLLARAETADMPTLRELFHEHGEQRRLLAHMRNQMEGLSYGEPNSIAVFERAGRGYLRAQREHSCWEEATLFPVAASLLGPDDDRALQDGFQRLDELWGTSVRGAERSLVEWLDQRRSLVTA